MKPVKPGYYFYKNEPVQVVEHGDKDTFPNMLLYFIFGYNTEYFVEVTEDEDWGEEILPPCKH